jgi:hypothetical protein
MADEHKRLAEEARRKSENWMVAFRTERQVARSLAPLEAAGYSFLHDRGWPGSRSGAQIDHVVVGPGGIFIVDTKSWAEVTIASGHIFRGQADVTDDLAGLADVGYRTEEVMANLGLPAGEVHVVVVLVNLDINPIDVGSVIVVGERQAAAYINRHGTRLNHAQTAEVFRTASTYFPELKIAPTRIDVSVAPQVVEETIQEPLFTVDEVTNILLAGTLAAPIEEWMAFLHPLQAKLVRRSFSGPSRIRGAAGTGKTVVGLHRAAYLARSQDKKILVTSFVKTLPEVLSNLLVRLAPEVADKVEFVGVHAFALRLLRDRGVLCNLRPAEATLAFNSAWKLNNEPLKQIDPNKRYWEDEIRKVVKGRGLTTFDEYADLARTGRRRPLTVDQRRSVWALHVAYDRELRSRGIHDFDDVILQAEASLRSEPIEGYAGVIIDEAQDLTCAMVRMLHLVGGDGPDGLTLIGDGQQSIYPGGFTLPEAGISISGRGVVMPTNYRNTREIVQYASAVIDGDEFFDIEGGLMSKDSIGEITRSGPEPTSMAFVSRAEHDAALVARIRQLDCLAGDIGVLSLTTQGVKDTLQLLTAAGIPAINLANYSGRPVDAVKVGTIKRAKGLEFKQVLLPRVLPKWLIKSAADDETLTIHRRELYVGMTRARDGLWIGVCS